MAMDAGSRATVTFNGTGVTWIGYRDAHGRVLQTFM